MVEQCGVSGTYLGLGTHTLLSAAGGIVAAVGQQFFAIDAQELALGELFLALEFLAESTCQRVALHLPELCRLNIASSIAIVFLKIAYKGTKYFPINYTS